MIFAPEQCLSKTVTVYSITVHTRSATPITSFHPKLNLAVQQSFNPLEILVYPSLSWLYFVSYDLFGLTDRKSALIWWVYLAVMSGKTLSSQKLVHFQYEANVIFIFLLSAFYRFLRFKVLLEMYRMVILPLFFIVFLLDTQFTACPSQQLLEFRNFLI